MWYKAILPTKCHFSAKFELEYFTGLAERSILRRAREIGEPRDNTEKVRGRQAQLPARLPCAKQVWGRRRVVFLALLMHQGLLPLLARRALASMAGVGTLGNFSGTFSVSYVTAPNQDVAKKLAT
ncbi:hypothetical protein V5799_019549 [Amblyomma americanum]|uniref:Uncharacterized protein n=1 Tax=Amblyomma americanum TaxID=6943 RepID=A0AAQ4EWJ9_AMBAM